MNRVLFDGIATQGTSKVVNHGGAEYAKIVLRELLDRKCIFDVVLNSGLISEPAIVDVLKSAEQEGAVRLLYVSNKQELYSLIDDGDYDIFYSALPYDYTDYTCKARLIGVVHGLRRVEIIYDEYMYRVKYAKKVFLKRAFSGYYNHFESVQQRKRTRHIKRYQKLLNIPNASFITVSNHSKYSLLNFYPHLSPDSITVFYAPFYLPQQQDSASRTTTSKYGDYYLMVSANRAEKNILRAIESFDRLFSEGRLEGKQVVVTGCNGVNFMRKIVNKGRFILLSYVSNEELEELFRDAFCFVYPSLNEGFGYPPIKAMSYGVPVIASSATSIPEVCAEGALIFSPTSCDDLRNRILQINYNTTIRAKYISSGKKRAQTLFQDQTHTISDMINMIIGAE